MNKSLRILQILEVVKALGRSTPKTIETRIALRMGADTNSDNLLRTIYRDLKELTDQGLLQAHYFLPDGTSATEEEAETARNVRIEYSLNAESGDGVIQGFNLLAANGFRFVTDANNTYEWKCVHLNSPAQLQNQFSIVVRDLQGGFLALQTPADQLPMTVVLGRPMQRVEDTTQLMISLREKFTKRVCYLFCPDASISRLVPNKKWGHCEIAVDGGGTIKVTDFNSSTGSHCTELPFDNLHDLILNAGSTATVSAFVSPNPVPENTVVPAQNSTAPCTVLRAGASFFYLVYHAGKSGAKASA